MPDNSEDFFYSSISGKTKAKNLASSYNQRKLVVDSFPTYSNENLKFQILGNINRYFLFADIDKLDAVDYSLSMIERDGAGDYTYWWFNASTSQLVTSGTFGVYCLTADILKTRVIILACDQSLKSQKWSYDGRNILSYDNYCLYESAISGVDFKTCDNSTLQQWSLYWSQGFPSDSTFGIQNYDEKRCFTGYGNNKQTENIALYECGAKIGGANLNQIFWRPSSDLRIETSLGFCIEWENRTMVRLISCTDAISQKWIYQDSYIKSVLDPTYCLSAPSNTSYSLTILNCTNHPDMQWKPYFPDTTVIKSFNIQSQYSNLCIDVPDSNFKNDRTLQIWECNDSTAQVFWRKNTNDYQLRTSEGKCIDWYRNQKVVLIDCNDTPNQRWNLDGNYIKSLVDTSICLSYENTNNPRGAKITFSQCNDPRSRWSQITFGSQTTLDHFGTFEGFRFDLFRCPNNTMVKQVEVYIEFIPRLVIQSLKIVCENGVNDTFGDMTKIPNLNSSVCSKGYTAAQAQEFSINTLVCATPPSSSPPGYSYCSYTNTSRQRIVGANIWYSSDQFYGIEPICDDIFGNYGGNFFTFQCPPGSFISKIDGAGLSRINGLTVSCSTGLDVTLSYGWTFSVGDITKQNANNSFCATPIQGVTIWFDVEKALFGLQPKCNATSQNVIGNVTQGGNERNDFTCPTGTSLVGIEGLADSHFLYRVSWICGDTSQPSQSFSFECQKGKRIVELTSSGDSFIKQIEAKCDDGNYSGIASNIGQNRTECVRGFTGAKMTYGQNISLINPRCGRRYSQTLGFTGKTGNKTQFSCPKGQVISGIKGSNRTGLLEGLFFVCQNFTDPPLDLAAIGYGFLTGFTILAIPTAVLWFIIHRRHKEEFRKHDNILPLR